MNAISTDTGPPVFDNRGRQIRGRDLAHATNQAIAKYAAVEYQREKLARAEDELLDVAAQVPAEDKAAYVEATDLIREDYAARIQARQDRRAAQLLAALERRRPAMDPGRDLEALAREMFPAEYAAITDDHPMDPAKVQAVKDELARRQAPQAQEGGEPGVH